MITPKHIKEPVCEVFYLGEKVGVIKSLLDLTDLRIQIKEANIRGYHIKYKDDFICITKHGRMNNPPKGFYDTYENQLDRILGI